MTRKEGRAPASDPPRRGTIERPENRIPIPRRPYRDPVIFYAVLAGLLVLVAFLTGGSLGRALVFGAAFFALATAWTWWRFHQRLAAQRRHGGGR